MGRMKLSLETMNVLDDGKITAAFGKELERVIRDCVDRPGDGTARQVQLAMTITPEKDETGACETVLAEVTIASRVPPRRTRPYQLAVSPAGYAIVNPASPGDVRQGTLDMAAGDGPACE